MKITQSESNEVIEFIISKLSNNYWNYPNDCGHDGSNKSILKSNDDLKSWLQINNGKIEPPRGKFIHSTNFKQK